MYYLIYFIIFLLILYISFYYIFPNDIIIYQTDINNFNFNMLYKKQPIVIEDNVKDIVELLQLWFSPNIINYNVLTNNLWNKNKYKYLILQANIDSEITLHKSKNSNIIPDENAYLTTIKLKNNKFLIIPFQWKYNINGDVKLYGIHDYITSILEYI